MAGPAPEHEEIVAPLDFASACLLARRDAADRAPEDDASEPDTPHADAPAAEDLLLAHSFGDRAVLLPSAGATRRLILETIRAQHRVAGRPKRRELLVLGGGMPLPPEFAGDADVVVLPDDEGAVRAAIGPKTAGLFVAPARLEAGLEMLGGALLVELREAADEYGLALVFDETDAGLGRTGMAFAHEWRGVTPDLMLVGEGAGLPVAALVLTAKYARVLPSARPGIPAGAAAHAGETLAVAFAPGFEGRIQSLGWQLEDRLAGLRYGRTDLFRDLVGTGLIQGLVCADPGLASRLADRLAERGLMVRALGAVLAFLPPLDVTEAEMAAAAGLLEQVVGETTLEAALP